MDTKLEQAIERLALALGRVTFLFTQLPALKVEPETQTLRYETWEQNPSLIVDVTSLIQLVLKNEVTLDDAYVVAKKHGLSEGVLRSTILALQSIPNIDAVYELFRRGEYDEEEYREAISRLGYSDSDTQSLLPLSERLPSVQDTITFLVREVFNPTLRENLQLDAEYPTEADREFGRLGVSPQNAQNYWASHWRLPSVTLAFEMFHRNLIEEEDLRFILRASDILPRFRDSIIAAAYRPITRVDVRRMHDMGVLDDDGVRRAYLDIGYSPQNAELMLQWTKLYNADIEEAEDVEEARQLTRSQIIRLFVRGVWDAETTVAELMQLGYNENLAQLLVLSEQIDLEQKQRDDYIDAIIFQYRNGVLNYETAGGLIAGAGVEGTELNIALNRLGVPEAAQVAEPSQGQLNRMLKQGLLTPQEYLDLLVKRGYSYTWASRFLESYGPGSTANNPRPVGKLQLDTQLKEAQITFDEWQSEMANIGYDAPITSFFIEELKPLTQEEIEDEEQADG